MSYDILHSFSFESQKFQENLKLPDLKYLSIREAGGPVNPVAEARSRANAIVKDYLRAVDPIFRELDDLREKGWRNPEGDEYFKNQRKRADESNNNGTESVFYNQNKRIGNELHRTTRAFTVRDSDATPIRALNLCMAPGGYTWSLLQVNPSAYISGITLPFESGGHPLLLPADPHIEVKFMDITMLSSEFGVSALEIPSDHPDAASFSDEKPYQGLIFDIILCDGNVLRTHNRAEYRQKNESLRLTMAQLILGMQRIKVGGTLIILLHKPDAWETVQLLKAFDGFSNIRLFKPRNIHAQRSSFYLVAKDVQPRHPEAINSIAQWKRIWRMATFESEKFISQWSEEDEEEVSSVLKGFSSRLVRLSREIWNIQVQALRKAPYTQQVTKSSRA